MQGRKWPGGLRTNYAVREGAAVWLGLSQRADNTEAGGGLAGVGATEAPGMGVM